MFRRINVKEFHKIIADKNLHRPYATSMPNCCWQNLLILYFLELGKTVTLLLTIPRWRI